MEKTEKFTYEITRPISVLSQRGNLTMELNLISYDGKDPVFDLRKWRTTNEGRRMQKGVTMTRDELLALRDVLITMEA